MSTLLDVRDLQVDYLQPKGKQIAALQGLSFTLEAGETLGVIGESGSGKSTVASALLALLPANGKISNGSIFLGGENLLEKTSAQLREVRGARIAQIFQEPSLALHPMKSIGHQVGEVLGAHLPLKRRERSRRVQEALEAVFDSDARRISSSYPHELSGGQRQRVAIAQAIVCRPQIVVADEPTASLDTVTQHAILTLFRELRQRISLTIIFITHNPALLAGFADRILVLYAGNPVEQGSAGEILFSPRHPYTRLLLQCAPQPNVVCGSPSAATKAEEGLARPVLRPATSALLPVIPGEAPDISLETPGCRFAERCPEKMAICAGRPPFPTILGSRHEVSCFLFEG